MRSVWKGSISFGLVNIPIAVYPATREEKVAFKQLRKSDISPIRYKKVAEVDEKEVPAEEIVKGYEYEKGKWVTLDDKDFEAIEIASTHAIEISDFASTHAIEISDFVDASEIDPKFYHKPYFLEAQKGGEKGYALLHRALRETGKVGIAKVAIRSREYLAAVKPDGLFLILEVMHFAQEVLDPEGLKTPAQTELSAKELEMAKSLIEALSSEWQPTKYEDRYQTAVREMIEAKVQNRPKSAKTVAPPPRGSEFDLVAILQESLKETTGKRKNAGSGSTGRRTGVQSLKTKLRPGPLANN